MRVFSCVWKINFPENIFSWPCVLIALTRKWFEVKIFTSNHFWTHVQRERERERERAQSSDRAPVRRPQQRTPQTKLQFDDQSCRSQHRADQAKIDSNTTRSRLCRAISPLDRTQSPLSLPSSLNLIGFDEFFFLGFVSFVFLYWPDLMNFFSRFCFFCISVLTGFDEFFSWVLFILCFCIEEWYYIFVWQLRKCEQ